MPEAPYGRTNRWLTCLTIDPTAFGATREDVRLALASHEIEARPVWKPMHLQPIFASARSIGGSVAEDLFDRGLCLPSGSNLTDRDLDEVIEIVRATCRSAR
jgi:dTDP-4-amino-4,6-dideoxygalactose transaminase